MVDKRECPRCRQSVLRVERVIQGTHAYLSYFCGACGHTWSVPDAPVSPPPVDGGTPKRKLPRSK